MTYVRYSCSAPYVEECKLGWWSVDEFYAGSMQEAVPQLLMHTNSGREVIVPSERVLGGCARCRSEPMDSFVLS